VVRLRVREIAESQGFDMAKLSRKADVAYRTIVRIWHDPQHDATMSTLIKIARAMGVRVADLILEDAESELHHSDSLSAKLEKLKSKMEGSTIVIRGHPHRGKTTFLQIIVSVLPLAEQFTAHPDCKGSADVLRGFIVEQLESQGIHKGLATLVHAELEGGHGILVLDGFDQIVDDESRRQVHQAVEAFATQYKRCQILIPGALTLSQL
jgi:transcriptional regulator with XRE-family HTH domain